MSVHITSPVWRIRGLTPMQKLILLKLADNANAEGRCWPSMQTISDECGCSVRTISRAILHFESIEILNHSRRFSSSNTYQFNLDTMSSLSKDRQDTMSDQGRHGVQLDETPCLDVQDTSGRLTVNEPSLETPLEPLVVSASPKTTPEDTIVSLVKPDSHGNCPHNEIVAIYNEVLGTELRRCMIPSASRKQALRRTWAFFDHNVQSFRGFYDQVKESDFLCGRNQKGRQWKATFDWLLIQKNLIKIIEGNYTNG